MQKEMQGTLETALPTGSDVRLQCSIGSMHSSHFGKKLGPFFTSFTGVTNDTNEGSVPFWSNRVRVLILCMLAHWKHSHGSLRGFQMDP